MAILCEFWWAKRRLALAAAVLIGLSFPVTWMHARDIQGNAVLEFVSALPIAGSVFLVFVAFNYTERDRRGRFSGFPVRTFTLPVSTTLLVTTPMVAGMVAIATVYLMASTMIFGYAIGVQSPLWPAILLASGMAGYQAILWSLAPHRMIKLVVLGVGGAFHVSLGVALATIEGTWRSLLPAPLGSWSIDLLLLAALTPWCLGFYLGALAAVHSQRHGGMEANSRGTLRRLLEDLSDRLRPRRREPFRSAAAAQFWYEWRRCGCVLPWATFGVLVLIMAPAPFVGEIRAETTVVTLQWILLTPIALAFAVGKGFGKADFWSKDLTVSPFLATRPCGSGDLIRTKVLAALASAMLTWALVFVAAAMWLGHWCDLSSMVKWVTMLGSKFSYERLWVAAGMITVLGVLFTWKLLVNGIYLGVAGERWRWHAHLSFVGALLLGFALLFGMLFAHHHPEEVRLFLIGRAPKLIWLCGALVLLKIWLAYRLWTGAVEREILSAGRAARYFAWWVGVTGCLVYGIWQILPYPVWIRNLLTLMALAFMPAVRLGVALHRLHSHRHA